MTKRHANSGTFHPIDQIAAEIVSDIGFRREVGRLHRLGPRVLAEYLGELAAERGIRVIVERKVNKYASLDPEALAVLGGDRFPPRPLYEVQQS